MRSIPKLYKKYTKPSSENKTLNTIIKRRHKTSSQKFLTPLMNKTSGNKFKTQIFKKSNLKHHLQNKIRI